jgi:hypothetical protein
VIETIMSIVAPTAFVKPEATLMLAAINDFGVGVNNSPELLKVSRTVLEDKLVSFPP